MEGLHSGWRSFEEIRGKLCSRIIKSHPSWIVIEAIMRDIAKGIRDLHEHLKSSNVLVSPLHKGRLQHELSQASRHTFECLVLDYECSVGVQGRGYEGHQKIC